MAEKEARLHGITTDEFYMYKFKVQWQEQELGVKQLTEMRAV